MSAYTQGLERATLNITGGSPLGDSLYTAYVNGITIQSGTLEYFGVDGVGNSEDINSATYETLSGGMSFGGPVLEGDTTAYFEYPEVGYITLLGGILRDATREVVENFSGTDLGVIQLVGLDPNNGYSGIAVGGKAAALKLGLFSGTDVWSTPLQNYIGKFQDTPTRPKQDVEVDLSQAVSDIQLLTLQIREIEQTLGKQLGKTQILETRRQLREQEKRVTRLRHEYLRAEDEEILLLLMT